LILLFRQRSADTWVWQTVYFVFFLLARQCSYHVSALSSLFTNLHKISQNSAKSVLKNKISQNFSRFWFAKQ
jgi:hypothetical protein